MDQQRKAEISININEFKEILDPTIQIIQAKKRGYYYRSGFTVHSYFSFGDYINPEILPESPLLAIVDYKMQQQEDLVQNQHPQMDIISIVLEGQLRQDNFLSENNQIKAGNFIRLQTDSEKAWHRESNSGLSSLRFIQLYFKSQSNPQFYIEPSDNITIESNYKLTRIQLIDGQKLPLEQRGSVIYVLIIDGEVNYMNHSAKQGDLLIIKTRKQVEYLLCVQKVDVLIINV